MSIRDKAWDVVKWKVMKERLGYTDEEMKIFRENDSAILEETDYQIDVFKHEIDTGDGELDMHGYFIRNRNVIFGQYLYLL